MFVNQEGLPFSKAGLTVYYTKMLRWRTGLRQHITPHRVRHIIVSFVQQNRDTFGGVEDQMAQLMGHACRQWHVSEGVQPKPGAGDTGAVAGWREMACAALV